MTADASAHAHRRTITGAALLLGAASLASRALGLLRDRMLAGRFGAGDTLDAYYAAFKVPDLIFSLLIIGALSTAFIPIFTKLLLAYSEKNPRENEAWKLVNDCAHLMSIILLAVVIILEIAAPVLVTLLAPGFDYDKRALTITFTRIMLLSPIFLSISALFGGVLQSMHRFFVFAITPILYNIGIIIGIVFLYPLIGAPGLAWGVVLGAFFHCITQIIDAWRSGYRYFYHMNWRSAQVKRILRLMVPRTAGVAVSQINILIITSFASTLGAGSIAVFNLANNLQSFPLSLFGISFALAAFPLLAEHAGRMNHEALRETLVATARKILFFMVPASLTFLLVRAQIVRVVLGSGSFSWYDTVRTADALAFFTLSLFAQGLTPLLARAFFALEDSMTPFIISIISELANVTLAWHLMHRFGVSGLALAFSLGNIVNAALLWGALRHRLHSLYETRVLQSLVHISAAGLALAVTIQLFKTALGHYIPLTTFLGVAAQGGFAGAAGLGVYGLLMWTLRNDEMIDLVESMRKKFFSREELPASDISLPS